MLYIPKRIDGTNNNYKRRFQLDYYCGSYCKSTNDNRTNRLARWPTNTGCYSPRDENVRKKSSNRRCLLPSTMTRILQLSKHISQKNLKIARETYLFNYSQDLYDKTNFELLGKCQLINVLECHRYWQNKNSMTQRTGNLGADTANLSIYTEVPKFIFQGIKLFL
uniref:Uncharacterized protein n=1 Tax=Romanomermis culicivorax TaxID=13658 RepID=A0A915J5L3_ROMCU